MLMNLMKILAYLFWCLILNLILTLFLMSQEITWYEVKNIKISFHNLTLNN